MTIFLCGFMGCGKSTAGKLAAKKLGLGYEDTDELIVKNEKISIPEIFSLKGEAYFREKEAEIVRSLCGRNIVAACGGGAMLNPDTAAAAREKGIVIFLNVPFQQCWERIKDDPGRPIAAASTRQELLELFNKRYDVYRKNSTITVECTGTPAETAGLIVKSTQINF